MNNLTFKFITILFLLISSCGNHETEIIDHYRVYEYGEAPISEGKNILMCKLGCKDDPIVKDVSSITWTKKEMLIKTSTDNYYFIKAKFTLKKKNII